MVKVNQRIILAREAGEFAEEYLRRLKDVREAEANRSENSEEAWVELSTVVFQLAGALSTLNDHLDDE